MNKKNIIIIILYYVFIGTELFRCGTELFRCCRCCPWGGNWQEDLFSLTLSTPQSTINREPDKSRAPPRLRKDKRRERAGIEMQISENNNLFEQSRGKEKISNLKCSWPLLSESSDGGSDSTFSHSDDCSGPS
ncbi:hypothetical protein AAZX31_14G113600 [Glycine max]|uniref:Uncharacterized protein n=2 Tax=Glycine subgen. Soja TaxID=1462606 RepID=K7M6C7_SOYBN|nr:uncharacterized protein LOC100775685 [Glycine max]XP_028199656.1 uncharacterized protein LOC114384202 [Glycine soja]KAG4953971.1 hypothetical protein JHK87_039565 [Glycine soja]KAG4962906.1 hypothetical protein JHK86_039774 [Glycine max]KAG4965376.1 hypothetical protein JHK85_040351 [Glycine max]KAG5110363.1 hypothetical protein JHK82_039586 [Glycine max]KAG5121648.1 hypothetical protein JHK84_039988 [Glycine max]|eukprot:XP_003544616.1 uncharacterized protein LOC100775685 [Glycine max]